MDNESKFQSNWRPAVGWIGALGLGYVAIVEPIARFVALVVLHYSGPFPTIDTSLTMQVLMGILGLGAMRSFDKAKGVESK
jgi:hypothetical protein